MRRAGARIALPALGVLGLVGLVTIAATGSTPSGSGDTRRPGDLLLDTFFSLVLVLIVVAALLFLYGLTQRQAIAEEIASGRYRRRGLGYFLLFFAFLAVAAYTGIVKSNWHPVGNDPDNTPLIVPGSPASSLQNRDAQDYHAEFAWIPVLLVLGLAALGLTAWWLSSRRRKAEARERDEVVESLAEAIEDTLGDLRAEADPRRAVIAAYARMERALAAFGRPRQAAETQSEYVRRILGDLEVRAASIRRLTDLFTRAKFSQHDVDEAMKEEAIDTLVQVRDELRIADERRQQVPDQRLLADSRS